jgi:hypothetical protein
VSSSGRGGSLEAGVGKSPASEGPMATSQASAAPSQSFEQKLFSTAHSGAANAVAAAVASGRKLPVQVKSRPLLCVPKLLLKKIE